MVHWECYLVMGTSRKLHDWFFVASHLVALAITSQSVPRQMGWDGWDLGHRPLKHHFESQLRCISLNLHCANRFESSWNKVGNVLNTITTIVILHMMVVYQACKNILDPSSNSSPPRHYFSLTQDVDQWKVVETLVCRFNSTFTPISIFNIKCPPSGIEIYSEITGWWPLESGQGTGSMTSSDFFFWFPSDHRHPMTKKVYI